MAGRELKVEIVGDASSLQKALGSATKTSDKFGSAIAKMGKLAVLGMAALGAGAVVAGKKMVEMASDAAEVQSKMEVIFGKELPELTKNLDKFSEATGASKFALREQAADMGALLEPLVGSKKGAADLSAQFVKLATDIGSFNNVPVDEALLAIRSGLIGEAEPLRRFGVLLDEASVKAEAYSSGIAKTGAELTQQQKVQARGNLIMEQTTLAQGDAIRTAGSAANQFKALKNNVIDLATNMGAVLLPAVTRVVQAINDNWPQIEKVITTVMTAATNAVASGIAAIQRNWNTIRSVAVAAFGGAKSAIQGLVNFLKTDFGQTVALGLGSILALRGGMAALGLSVTNVSKALGAFRANPLWAALIPLGFAVGAITKKFIEDKMEAENVAAAWDRAEGSARRLKSAIDALRDTQINIRQAQEDVWQATQRVVQSRDAYLASVQKEGQNSSKTIALLHDYRQALIDLDRSEATLSDARKDRTTQLGGFRKETTEAARSILTLAEGTDKMSNAGAKFSQLTGLASKEAQTFAQKLNDLAPKQDALAQKYRDSQPAAAGAAAKTAELARNLADLAIKTGKVPDKKTIIAQARLIGGDAFAKAMLGIITGSDKAADESKKNIDRIPDAMDAAADDAFTAGLGLGSSLFRGVNAGVDRQLQATLTKVANAGRQIVEQIHNVFGNPPPPATAGIELGESFMRGIVLGIARNLAEASASTKDTFRQFIGEATNIVETIQAKGYNLGSKQVQAVIDGILGKTPSLKQQFLTALDEMNAAGIQRLAQSREGVASAFAGVATAALAAFDAVTDAWVNPLRAKLEADTLQAEADKQAQAIIDAQAKMDAAQQRTPPLKLGEIPSEDWKKAEADYLAAKAEFDAAVKAQADAELQRQIAVLDYEHAEKRKILRGHLQDDLDDIANSWPARKGKTEIVHEKTMALLKSYGLDYRKVGRLYGKELSDGIVDAVKDLRAALDELSKNLKGSSPPPKGPLREIDKWGYKVGRAWMNAFAGAFKPTRGDEKNWADLLSSIDKGIGATTEFSFGGPEPTGSPFANQPIPGQLNPSLYQFAAQLAADAGKFDEFVEDMGKQRTNARLLDLLFQNRSRFNWSKYPAWIANIMNTMRDLMLSGAEAAPLFGLRKGGITQKEGWRYLHAPEAVIPLNDSRADRYLGGSSRGSITVVLEGGTYIGGDPDAIARDMAPALNTALGKLVRSGTPLAYQG